MYDVKVKLLSSLEKVFWDEELKSEETKEYAALKGETVSFQAAVYMQDEELERFVIKADAKTNLENADVSIFEVGQVPVFHPVMKKRDKNYLRTKPGLFPDPLFPHEGKWSLATDQWRCLWISVKVPEDAKSGNYSVSLKLTNTDKEKNDEITGFSFDLKVIDAVLPEQKLLLTEWFHVDCLANYYNVPVYSEEHWALIRNYMRNAADFGVNLIFTPILTPPIDTEIGGERPTVQLVDITLNNGNYIFDFSKLDRYMSIAEESGIDKFEFSHLFTQWGAKAAPKVMATVNGEYKKLFGWDTPAESDEYVNFLNVFITELKNHLKKSNRLQNCMFHISDEPQEKDIESYISARNSVKDVLEDCIVIDALSEYDFYEKGIIKHPIPSIDKLDEFLEKGFEDKWTYYCCGQVEDVSNRFLSMPSARNRILGYQLYKYGIKGFLQWGFNFWNSFLSRRFINPFYETGSEDAFPAGDAYMVYPGEDGNPIPSLHEYVFYEALQDMRALELLESLTSKAEVMNIIEADEEVTLKKYPQDAKWILDTRNRINNAIEKAVKA